MKARVATWYGASIQKGDDVESAQSQARCNVLGLQQGVFSGIRLLGSIAPVGTTSTGETHMEAASPNLTVVRRSLNG